jgi:hypothetical protein
LPTTVSASSSRLLLPLVVDEKSAYLWIQTGDREPPGPFGSLKRLLDT